MKANDSDKKQLRDNLTNAVCNCKQLKIGYRNLDSSFTIVAHSFLDFTTEKYEDGKHSYRMDVTIKIENKSGEYIEERCDIHFDAQIEGTKAIIEHGIVIVDKDFYTF